MKASPPGDSGLYAVLRRNIASGYLNYLIVGIVGFFLAPFVVHSLGDERYGIWVLVGSLTGHLGLVEAGLMPGIVRAVAEKKAVRDVRGLGEVFGATRVLLAVAALVVILGALGLAVLVERWFTLPVSHLLEVRWLVLLAGLTVAAETFAANFRGALAGAQRYDLTSLLSSAASVFQAGGVVLVLSLGCGLIALGSLALGSAALAAAGALILVRREFPGVKLYPRTGSLGAMRAISDFSLKALAAQVAARLAYYSDAAVIAWALGTAAVTPYAIAGRLVEYGRHFVRVMGTGLVPAASAIAATGDRQRQRELLLRTTRYVALVEFPLFAMLLVSGESLLRVWMGPAYAGSHLVLKILVIGHVVSLLHMPAGLMLYGVGRPGLVATAAITEGVANLGLSVLLVRPLGIAGVALGTALPALCIQPALWIYTATRIFHVRILDLVRHSVLGPLLASVPFTLTLGVLDSTINPATRASFFLTVAAAGLTLLPGLWLIGLNPMERSRILAWASLSELPGSLVTKP